MKLMDSDILSLTLVASVATALLAEVRAKLAFICLMARSDFRVS
jgi:hypothetical protein